MIFSPLTTEPDPLLQQVEVATFRQLPSLQIVGLPGPEVAEAKERVRSAVESSGLEFPKKKVVVNLSPASIRKRGTGIDLAIAVSVLLSSRKSKDHLHKRIAAWGELGLNGDVKPGGQISRCLYAAWRDQVDLFIVAQEEFAAAVQVRSQIKITAEYKSNLTKLGKLPDLYPVSNLKEAWFFLQKPMPEFPEGAFSVPISTNKLGKTRNEERPSSALLRLEPVIERVICVAVAGFHHLLFMGPKGVGKSAALEWGSALQPPFSADDSFHRKLITEMKRDEPFTVSEVRRVSPSSRPASLIGGATASGIHPGEFSLAHGGVLIADELPEWHRDSREALREPLERRKITLTRTHGAFQLPARFQLLANGNLCPCGGWPSYFVLPQTAPQKIHQTLRCRCRPGVRRTYLSRISGPILDRLDITFIISQPPPGSTVPPEEVGFLRSRVSQIRERLKLRWGGLPGLLPPTELEGLIEENPGWSRELDVMNLPSLRSRHKVLRLAMTLAEWDECESIKASHFYEALSYRPEKTLLMLE